MGVQYLYVDRGGGLKATKDKKVAELVAASGGKARLLGECAESFGVENVNNNPVINGIVIEVDTIIKDDSKIVSGSHIVGTWFLGQGKSEGLRWVPMQQLPKPIQDFLKKYGLYFNPTTKQLDYWYKNGMKSYNPL